MFNKNLSRANSYKLPCRKPLIENFNEEILMNHIKVTRAELYTTIIVGDYNYMLKMWTKYYFTKYDEIVI